LIHETSTRKGLARDNEANGESKTMNDEEFQPFIDVTDLEI
jgi:hypothetical protein